MLKGMILPFAALLCVDMMTESQANRCPGKTPQYFDGKKCNLCFTCQPGQGLSEVCGNGRGGTAFCRDCAPGYFSDSYSAETCERCRICPTEMEEDKPCSRTSDRTCVACKCGLVNGHCGSCEYDNSSDTSYEPGPPAKLNPALIAVYVTIPLALALVLLGVFCIQNNDVFDIWGFFKRSCSLSCRDDSNSALNAGSTANTRRDPEEQQCLEGHGGVSLCTSADSDIVPEVMVPLTAVPDQSQSPVFDSVSPISQSCSTQTERFSYSDASISENQRWEFEQKLQRAIDETKGTALGDMNQADLALLHRLLQAKGAVAKYHSTADPNYLSIAEMYGIDRYTQREFETVEDVISHIANTDRTHPTVAHFLQRVYASQECFHPLGKFVEQILDRTKASGSRETWL